MGVGAYWVSAEQSLLGMEGGGPSSNGLTGLIWSDPVWSGLVGRG